MTLSLDVNLKCSLIATRIPTCYPIIGKKQSSNANMSLSNDAIFDQLVVAIRTIPTLPIPSYVSRLHNKARHSLFTREMFPFLSEEPRFPQDDRDADSQRMDGVLITDLLGRFSNANQVRALGNVDDYRDKFNFRGSVHLVAVTL